MGRITLYGFYKYRPDLFDDVDLPEGLDKNMLIAAIMEKSGMLFTYHQQPDYLKINITYWFTRKKASFTRMYAALTSEYSPIENYDRFEEWTDTPDITYAHNGVVIDTQNSSGSVQTENTVSAFNDTGYVPESKSVQTPQTQLRSQRDYNNENTTERGTRTHQGRMHGNIGVTTNQQMIEAELQLRLYDLYEVIADLFERRFLMQNY